MRRYRFAMAALVACVVTACMCGLAACSNSGDSASNSASGGTAATVNGVAIPEQEITDQIEQIREQSGLADADQWGQFLVENDMTPSSVREQFINTLTQQEVVVQGAAGLGVAVEDSEVDENIAEAKANYESVEDWNNTLEQAGFTEESYCEMVRESLYEQKVGEYFDGNAEVTDEDIVASTQDYASYYGGAKRSSHILFGVSDMSDEEVLNSARQEATEVLARINSGELDFAAAAAEYSTDESSKANGGDVGWNHINSFVDEYADALEDLELGQVSGLVTSQYGVHIIKVTDVYDVPEDLSQITSIEQVPEEFRDAVENMAKSVQANSDYNDWPEAQMEKADIVVNDMPSGLPYDIDLAPYQEATGAATGETTADVSEAASSESSSSTAQ